MKAGCKHTGAGVIRFVLAKEYPASPNATAQNVGGPQPDFPLDAEMDRILALVKNQNDY